MKRSIARPTLTALSLTLALALVLAAIPATASACDNEIRIAPKTLNERPS